MSFSAIKDVVNDAVAGTASKFIIWFPRRLEVWILQATSERCVKNVMTDYTVAQVALNRQTESSAYLGIGSQQGG